MNSLLPNAVFVKVVSGLMANDLPLIRRKAMELLNSKLAHPKEQFDAKEVRTLSFICRRSFELATEKSFVEAASC